MAPPLNPPCSFPAQEERHARAAALGVSPEQVPTAEGLTVRVVNNVVKKNEVKSRFYEAFRGDGYPEAFLYKQKVRLAAASGMGGKWGAGCGCGGWGWEGVLLAAGGGGAGQGAGDSCCLRNLQRESKELRGGLGGHGGGDCCSGEGAFGRWWWQEVPLVVGWVG